MMQYEVKLAYIKFLTGEIPWKYISFSELMVFDWFIQKYRTKKALEKL